MGGVIEVEARFRLAAGGCAVRAAERLGVCLGEPVCQDDQAYAPVGWDYGQDRIQVTFARLRSQGQDTLFTVKRPVSDVRTCIEHECRVDDRDAMHEAILLMGFAPTVRIVKTRRSGRLHDRFELCVDDVQGVGTFIEIEAMAAAGEDHERLRSELERLVEGLEVDVERCSETYDALVHAAACAA